jgi:hypothetical protein
MAAGGPIAIYRPNPEAAGDRVFTGPDNGINMPEK